MPTWTEAAAQIWRDYITDGVPSSGKYRPEKSEIRTWGDEVETAIEDNETSAAANATAIAANTTDIATNTADIATNAANIAANAVNIAANAADIAALEGLPQIVAAGVITGGAAPTIGRSYGITTVTQVSTGVHEITFTSAEPNANYAVSVNPFTTADATGHSSAQATTLFRVITRVSGTPTDMIFSFTVTRIP